MQGHTVVFDLDGTLIDTAPDLIGAANRTVERAGYQAVPPADLRPHISFGGRHMIVTALAMQDIRLAESDVDAMFEGFVDDYAGNIAKTSRPFDGLLDVLDHLEGTGARIAVCTNKREDLARLLLDALNMTQRFQAITGRDTFPVCKPDPEHLLGTLRLAGGDPKRAVMVGDSDTDVQTARAAAIPVIGVTFGYTDIPMTELDATAVISSYDAFVTTLDRLLAQSQR